MATWTTATRTWAAGETLTAANMNAQIRDFANGFGAWTSYTPTLTQGVSVACTVNYAKYAVVQKMVWANIYLTATASGTSGSAITVSLPPSFNSAQTSGLVIGTGLVYRSATTTIYSCAACISSASSIFFVNDASGAGIVGSAPSYQVVSNDVIRAHIVYEAS